MQLEPLPPGVQYAEESALAAEALDAGKEALQAGGARLEEKVVEQRLVVPDQRVQDVRNSEYAVVILGREKPLALSGDPSPGGPSLALGAVAVAAAVVGDYLLAAPAHDLDARPELICTAGLNTAENLGLLSAKRVFFFV